jgi:hypothetical protein
MQVGAELSYIGSDGQWHYTHVISCDPDSVVMSRGYAGNFRTLRENIPANYRWYR